MFRAFASPMKAERSRNKERLEASLAGLCELELLKQRQECLVLSALCLGDSGAVHGRPAWGDLRGGGSESSGLRRQQSGGLQCTPWGIMASLEEQVAELGINRGDARPTESPADAARIPEETPVQVRGGEDLCSHAPVDPGPPQRPMEPENPWPPEAPPRAQDPAERLDPTEHGGGRAEGDHQEAQRAETYISGLIQRRIAVPRPSKPRTNAPVTVARQGSLCRKEEQHAATQGQAQSHMTGPPCPAQSPEGQSPQACRGLEPEHRQEAAYGEDAPLSYQQLQPGAHPHAGFYPRTRQHAPPRATSLDHPPCRGPEADGVLRKHFSGYPSPPPPPPPAPPADEQLVNAEYIPAQPCRTSTQASSTHHHPTPLRSWTGGDGPPEQQQPPAAQQPQHARARAGPRKGRQSEERSGATRRPGRKACRSQSENSLQRVPERRYNTVERDGSGGGGGGGSGSGSGKGSRGSQSRGKKSQQGGGGYRRWRSTLELSQDEAEPPQASAAAAQRDHCGKRTRKSRPTHGSYSHAHPNHHLHHSHQNPMHHHHHHHQQQQQLAEYGPGRDQAPPCRPSEGYPHPGQGESESSSSEADSPDSSSLSSDSDESGGLVWPQQLPPQLSLPAPPAPSGAPLQPKAFVKIKASHALKKKILRFRTGSLKVMTTV